MPISAPEVHARRKRAHHGPFEVGGCTWTKPRGDTSCPSTHLRGVQSASCSSRRSGRHDDGCRRDLAVQTRPLRQQHSHRATLPPLYELREALNVFVCCVKMATRGSCSRSARLLSPFDCRKVSCGKGIVHLLRLAFFTRRRAALRARMRTPWIHSLAWA